MSKVAASVFSVAMAVAILAPLHEPWRGEYGDSFPFSWYPMFSRPRPHPERSVYVVGEEPDGTRHYIHSSLYARGSMNQARRQLQTMVATPESSRDLCERVAKRLAGEKHGVWSRVDTVRVARGWFHTERYFGGGSKEPVREQTYAACAISRTNASEAVP